MDEDSNTNSNNNRLLLASSVLALVSGNQPAGNFPPSHSATQTRAATDRRALAASLAKIDAEIEGKTVALP
jgi:hypothetical protein